MPYRRPPHSQIRVPPDLFALLLEIALRNNRNPTEQVHAMIRAEAHRLGLAAYFTVPETNPPGQS